MSLSVLPTSFWPNSQLQFYNPKPNILYMTIIIIEIQSEKIAIIIICSVIYTIVRTNCYRTLFQYLSSIVDFR